MKPSNTVIFLAAVVGLCLFTYFEFKNESLELLNERNDSIAVAFDIENLNSLRIKNREIEIFIEKQVSGWKMTSPIQDVVDRKSVRSYIALLSSKRIDKLKDIPKDPASNFGLIHPLLEIDINSKTKTKLKVGSINAFDGSFYIQKGQDYYLGDSGWSHVLRKSTHDFRSKNIFRSQPDVVSFQIKGVLHGPTSTLSLVKDNKNWRVKEDSAYAVSQPIVVNFLNNLLSLQFRSVVYEKKDRSNLVKTGLYSPSLEIIVNPESTKTKQILSISSASKNEVFLTINSENFIAEAAPHLVSKIISNFHGFKDPKIPFQFNSGDVKKLKYISEQGKTIEIDKDLESVLKGFDDLKAKTFFTKSISKLNLNSRIILSDAKGQSLFDLKWGGQFLEKPDFPPLFYAKTSSRSEVFGVELSKLNLIVKQIQKQNSIEGVQKVEKNH